ncbi:MAG TPA: DNA methyltransferase [Anaerolineae bacterium]|nr:DNA methyltransferase [Anaerolineae bacterium]HQI87232.1 DNA methyltransferase [Anaerolineae bacterium]
MESIKEARQLYLFDKGTVFKELDARFWHGSFLARESTLQQLSPYVGKMKSGMAKVLVELYSDPGDIVFDPFCGSGVVPLEALLAEREAWANDLSPYAYAITRAKMEASGNLHYDIDTAHRIIKQIEKEAPTVDISTVPEWVQEFFHPDTLREVLTAFRILQETENYFLLGCLLGILHHVRPGFLSYPSSHLVPYLRKKKYPPEEFPEMYTYRDLRTRLLAKIRRAYHRAALPVNWEDRRYRLFQTNARDLPIEDNSVDVIISSPPYFGALDYARDNRLRLWFLGYRDWKELDASLTANAKVYIPQMTECLLEMDRVLKPEKYCVLVLGDVEKDGKNLHTAEILADLAINVTQGRFVVDEIYDDRIPDERRARRRTQTTKFERILVMHKNY